VLAKQVATLDVISGGRFRLGLGIGAYPEEHQAVWPDRRVHRGRAFDESVTVLRDLFQERSVTFDGEFVKVRGVESYPKPLQSPLPMYFGGHTLRAVERAAAWGQGWMPGWQPLPELRRRIEYLWRCLDESGRPRSAVEVAPQLSVTIAKTDSEAMDAYWASGLVQHRLSLAYTGRDLSQQAEANLVGSPSTIRAKVRALAELGVQHGCALWFTAETVQGMLDQMEWFAHDVMEGRHDLI
jgi:alkanesulfonate monooxygenase SsuD/methylene tetrahydromethanopterin reductase-like flavin-dependent oxidoreductase (luciferase family)